MISFYLVYLVYLVYLNFTNAFFWWLFKAVLTIDLRSTVASLFSPKISSQIKPEKFEIFETETYFRLKNSLSCQKPKFAGQELFLVFWTGNVFPIQNWDSFQTKNQSQF